jgi:hypothetical protein
MKALTLLRVLFIAGVMGSFAVTWGMVKDKDGKHQVGPPALPMLGCGLVMATEPDEQPTATAGLPPPQNNGN